jgi:uncharacterized protein (DUF697 family)
MKRTQKTRDVAPAPTGGKLAEYLLEKGIAGVGPLSSAEALAREYLDDASFESNDARVDALVLRETTKNFATGFVTGLGGFLTLPVAVPSALAASWVLQARLAAAIARIHGHDLSSARTRTSILLSLAGDVAREAMGDLGVPFSSGNRLTRRAVEQVPGRALVEINKRIGVKLLARAGQRTLNNFSRFVPLLGGVVGGTIDAVVCRMVARTARELLAPAEGEIIDGEIVNSGSRGAVEH